MRTLILLLLVPAFAHRGCYRRRAGAFRTLRPPQASPTFRSKINLLSRWITAVAILFGRSAGNRLPKLRPPTRTRPDRKFRPARSAVTSITLDAGGHFAIINGKMMGEGQEFGLQMGSQTYQITVKAIQDGQVISAARSEKSRCRCGASSRRAVRLAVGRSVEAVGLMRASRLQLRYWNELSSVSTTGLPQGRVATIAGHSQLR